ncbi:MAG TPA: tetratricopeptide repeat protein [Bryobacteraceae bacterium]|nr:tetratricopeptide repeat protein [Bryobacteraceae bacterium]
MFRRVLVSSVLAAACLWLAPSPLPAASKEIEELQRDVAQLQDQVKQLQQSQDRQLAQILVLVQQSLNAANDASKSVAVIQSGFQQNLQNEENKVVTPVVGLNTRMDQMSQDMRTLQQAVTDLTGLISKMQAQMTDLGNAVKVMQAPAPPPPGASAGGNGGGSAALAPSSENPTMPASDLYANANRDRQGGKLDLALQEFSDYLHWYGNTDLAPNAQYYIAWIHASQGDYDNAIREYDMVLEKYPDNNKTADALYGKGMALTRVGRRTDGAREFQELIKRFPNNSLSTQACTQLTNLGLKCPPRTRRAAR